MSSADFDTVPAAVDEKDRHVAAAALALRHAADKDAADDEEGLEYDVVLLTDNVKDFAKKQMKRLGVRVLRPGQFLDEAFDANPDAMARALLQAAKELKKPPYTVAELLYVLRQDGAKRLVAGMSKALGIKPVAREASDQSRAANPRMTSPKGQGARNGDRPFRRPRRRARNAFGGGQSGMGTVLRTLGGD